MIPAENWCKTHDQKLLAIVEDFMTLQHYLEVCQFEVLILTNHNNLRLFMNTKSLSFRQVRSVLKLSWYYFQIHYHQGKANLVVDALLHFHQRSQSEEKELQAENIEIIHQLQSSLTNASVSGLSSSCHKSRRQAENLLPLHQVLICGNYIFPRLCQFWEKIRQELTGKQLYQQVCIAVLSL